MTYMWDNEKSNLLELGKLNNWKLCKGSFLDDDVNMVEFFVEKLERSSNNWGVVLGITSNEDMRRGWLGKDNRSWGLTGNGGLYHSGEGNPYSNDKLKSGDIIRMTYSKLEKTLSFEVNGKDNGIAFRGVEGRVRIAVSAWLSQLTLRLTSGPVLVIGNEDVALEDEKERIEFVGQKFGDLNLQLKNQIVRVWSAFFSATSSTQNQLGKLALNILDKRILLSFLLSRPFDVKSSLFPDYFLFFKCFGMKEEMALLFARFPEFSFEEGFHIFKDFSISHENEMIQSWFTLDPSFSESFSFDHSLSQFLFNRLKDLYLNIPSESEQFRKVMKLVPGINVIIYHLTKFRIQDPVKIHIHFLGKSSKKKKRKKKKTENLKKCNSFDEKLKLLWYEKKRCNVLLKTRDGGEFKVHREVLVLKSNFFYRMIKFGGEETETLRLQGLIVLEELNKKLASSLLEFIYTGEVSCISRKGDLKTCLLLFVHGEKFHEFELQKKMLEEVKKLVIPSPTTPNSFSSTPTSFGSERGSSFGSFSSSSSLGGNCINIERIRGVVSEIGYIFSENENVNRFVFPILETRISNEEIWKLIVKSKKNRVNSVQMVQLQEKVKKQDTEIENLKDEIQQMKKTIKNLESLILKKK